MLKKSKRLNFKPDFSFQKSLSLKDFSLENLLKKRPDLALLTEQVTPLLEPKKFLTIDYSELILKPGEFTCKSDRWHVDGIDNNYLIVAFGDFRTCFLNKQTHIESNLEKTNISLARLYKDMKGEEIEEGVPVIYTSEDIHRGQRAVSDGKRVFLRLCYSDYLSPKNKVLK